jgi:small subunit ribosomal protein S21
MSIAVQVKGDIERAIKLLKKRMELEGVRKELGHRRFYEKPSMKRKRKRREASQRRHKSRYLFYERA